eukprot:Em0001g1961a
MKGVKILDVSAWPSDDSSDSFGLEEILGMIEHFKPLLLKHDIVVASIIDYWRAFKTYWAGAKQIKGHQYLGSATRMSSNAKVERGFSSMRRIKMDWRSRLGERTLDNLMRISVDGPAVSDFCSDIAVKRFFAQPRRPDVLPYGPRKRTHDDTKSTLDGIWRSTCMLSTPIFHFLYHVASKRVKDTMASEEVEDTMASEGVEDMMASEEVEDMMASEEVEDTMGSEGVEDMMASEGVEDAMASEVEDSQKLEDEVTSEEVKDEMGEIQVEDTSNAEGLGSDFDAADDEDDSYAEAENDADCNSDTYGDLNAAWCSPRFSSA